nr:Bromodomain containing protein [Hymenolepis microstoma]
MAFSNSSFSVNKELEAANQILTQIMSNHSNITLIFMNRINGTIIDMPSYDEMIRYPVWLKLIASNLQRDKYPGIREFVCDFRLMIANCFRFNGVNTKLGRMAEKLETLFEQKLQLLPCDLRTKTTMRACLGIEEPKLDSDSGTIRRRATLRHFGSGLDSQICPVRALMEEIEHAIDLPDFTSGFSSSTPTPAIAVLYESAPDTPVNTSNSFALLVARLTEWRAKQHEAELISSFKDWWSANTQAKEKLDSLRKCPQFLEVYQHLWLLDPFIGISDAMCAGTMLYHNAHNVFTGGDGSVDSALLPFSSKSITSNRTFCLAELEFALAGAPQASICLSAGISALINTPRQREMVEEAIKALKVHSEDTKPANGINGNVSTKSEAFDDLSDSDEVIPSSSMGEKVRIPPNRRILNSHINTLKELAVPSYEVWERRLSAWLDQIYEDLSLEKRLEEPTRSERRYGISFAFFEVCGKEVNPLKEKRFHQLTLLQQVNILLALTSSLLLSNGSLCFSENLRFSIDKADDWNVCNPTILGIDPFRGITYMHFPQMLSSESPRVFHYRYPTPDYDAITPVPSNFLPALTINTDLYALPTPVFRLPSWMDKELAQGVISHVLNLVESEITALSNRIVNTDKNSKNAKKDKQKMNHLNQVMLYFKAVDPKTGCKNNKSTKSKSKSRKSSLPPPCLNGIVQDIQLSAFTFVDKLPCGVVPTSVTYARPSNYVSKSSMRQVESTASLAESTANTTTNTSEAPTPNPPPSFFQEEDDNSNFQASSNNSEVNFQPDTLEDEGSEVQPPISPSTEALSCSQDAIPVMDEEAKAAENELMKKTDDLLEQAEAEDCKTATEQSEAQKGKVEVKAEMDRAKEIYNMIIKATEVEIDKESSLFETVVFDFDSLKNFSEEITHRLSTARHLLEELTEKCKVLEDQDQRLEVDQEQKSRIDDSGSIPTVPLSNPLRKIIDRFTSELGDGVYCKSIKTDRGLMDLLDGLENTVKKEEEEALNELISKAPEMKAPKNSRKRRSTAPLTLQSQRKKARRSAAANQITENVEEELIMIEKKLSPQSRLVEIYEQAVDSLSELDKFLTIMKEEVNSNQDERLATERTAGMLLRKDIEFRLTPPAAVEKKRTVVSIKCPSQIQTTTATAQQQESARPTVISTPVRPIIRPSFIAPSPARILPSNNRGTVFIRRPVSSNLLLPRPNPPLHPQVRPRIPPSRIFRFYGNLFTEDGSPVRLGPDGRTMIQLPPESIPSEQRQAVLAQIQRYRSATAASTLNSINADSVNSPAVPSSAATQSRPSVNSLNSAVARDN